jgi:hypothetical protein
MHLPTVSSFISRMTQTASPSQAPDSFFFSKGPRRIAQARKLVLFLPLIGFTLQAIIEHSYQNLLAAFLAATGAYIVFYDSFRIRRLYYYPISSLVQFAFGLTLCLGPLLFTAFEGKPVIYNLEVPSITFLNVLLIGLVSTLSHYVYRKSAELYRLKKLIHALYLRLDCFRPLRLKEVIVLGAIGLVAISLTQVQADADIDDAARSFKFLQGFRFMSMMPAVYLLQKLWSPNDDRRKAAIFKAIITFVVFLGLTVIASILMNKREIFVRPAGALFIGLGFAYFYGLLKIRTTHIIASLLALLLLIPLANDLSTAMVMVRSVRADIPPEQLLVRTFDQMQNREALQAFKVQRSEAAITLDPVYLYIGNAYFNVLAPGKFMDYSHVLSRRISYSGSLQMLRHDVLRLLAVLPTPFLEPFGYTSNLKLDVLTGNAADRFESFANDAPLSPGFKVMHFSGLGIGTYGYFYLLILFVFLVLAFPVFDAHSISGGSVGLFYPVLSIIAFASLFEWFQVPLQNSMVDLFWILIRYIQEPVLLLFVARALLKPLRSI